MPVVVDYNICDNVEGCPAVAICDAGALHFDTETRRVEYDREACRDCGTCANYCAPAAVMHVATDEEWQELKTMMQG
ncbi:MAG: 4Fe-4S dicluster domain-containing protein [Chloroflexota bacterium]